MAATQAHLADLRKLVFEDERLNPCQPRLLTLTPPEMQP